MPELTTLLPLVLLAFTAGMIDAAVGGGGLVQVPGLFAVLPGQSPAALLGTNKFSSICGTSAASWRYLRHVQPPWRIVLPATLFAFVFAFAGASVASRIPKDVMRPVVLVLLIGMLIYTLRRHDFGAAAHIPVASKGQRRKALALGAAIGFYDGVFGPGTGSFLLFLFVRVFGLDFLGASAATKVVNFATNLAALCFFVPSGMVLYGYALPMAGANILGAVVGARLAVQGGAALIRRFFIALVIALISKMAWDVFGL